MAPLLDPAAAGLGRYRLVALAGVDGGGKTYLLNALQKRLDLNGVPVWRATDIEDWIAALPQRRFKGDREPGSSGDA